MITIKYFLNLLIDYWQNIIEYKSPSKSLMVYTISTISQLRIRKINNLTTYPSKIVFSFSVITLSVREKRIRIRREFNKNFHMKIFKTIARAFLVYYKIYIKSGVMSRFCLTMCNIIKDIWLKLFGNFLGNNQDEIKR